jgi:hypothetical protein
MTEATLRQQANYDRLMNWVEGLDKKEAFLDFFFVLMGKQEAIDNYHEYLRRESADDENIDYARIAFTNALRQFEQTFNIKP